MITHKETESDDAPSFEILGAIETMILTYNLSEGEKKRFKRLSEKVGTNEQAKEIMSILQNYRPIMGIERVPQDVREVIEAVRNRMDVEDFKERNK